LIPFLSIAPLFGQQDFVIKGIIMNSKTKTPVESSVYVTVSSQNKILYKVNCNNNGEYSINVSDSLNQKQITLQVSQDQNNLDNYLTTKPTDPCSFYCLDNKLFSSSSKERITLKSDSLIVYSKDFKLSPVIFDLICPMIYFKKNELLMVQSDYYLTADSALCFLKNLLNCRKKMVIEVAGYCAPNEKNKAVLSLKRALLVKEYIVTLGIDPKRIVVKGYSDKNYKQNRSYVKKDRELNGDYRPAYINKIDYEWQTVIINQLRNDFGIQIKNANEN
jgi:outer membrane protein OmpA-like peptidoglycan-associated protein